MTQQDLIPVQCCCKQHIITSGIPSFITIMSQFVLCFCGKWPPVTSAKYSPKFTNLLSKLMGNVESWRPQPLTWVREVGPGKGHDQILNEATLPIFIAISHCRSPYFDKFFFSNSSTRSAFVNRIYN